MRRAWRFDPVAFQEALTRWLRDRRHTAAFVFVSCFTYMAVTTAAVRALDCLAPIQGVAYLRVDLRLACFQGQHVVAQLLAYSALVCFTVGLPVLVVWKIGCATPSQLEDEHFRAAWGFVYEGYRGAAPLPSVPTPPPASKAPGAKRLSPPTLAGRQLLHGHVVENPLHVRRAAVPPLTLPPVATLSGAPSAASPATTASEDARTPPTGTAEERPAVAVFGIAAVADTATSASPPASPALAAASDEVGGVVPTGAGSITRSHRTMTAVRRLGKVRWSACDPIPASHSWICSTPTQHANSLFH
jgi:hypothetical protein